MLYAFEHGEQGDLFVQKAPATTIETLAQAVLELKHSDLGATIIGSTASLSVIIKRAILGFVIVRGFPSSIRSQNSGMTEPREAMTLPYRVKHRTGFPGSICLERAITFFSMTAFVIPIALMG